MKNANNNTGDTKSIDVYGDYAITRVPNEERRSFLSTFLVYNGVVICAAALWTGHALAEGLNLINCVIATIIGFTITGIIGGALGIVGAREGVSSTMLARHVFGRYGAIIIGLIFAITNWGWYGFQAGFFGTIINTMFPGHFFTQPQIAALWGGLLMMITAAIGYEGVAFLSFLAIPLMLVIIGASDAALISQIGFQKILNTQPINPMTLAQGITLAAGGMAVGSVISPDVSRYAKKDSHAFWGFFIALVVVNNFVIISGAALSHGTGSPNLPEATTMAGLGVSSLVMLILAQWTTNDNNLYSTTLALINLIPIKKSILTVILGVTASIAAYLGIADLLVPFLNFLGTYIPPIGGIMLAHYFLITPICYEKTNKFRYRYGPGTEYHGIDILAVIFIFLSGFIGSKIPGISAINSLIVGFLGYSLLAFLFEKLDIKYKYGKKTESDTGY